MIEIGLLFYTKNLEKDIPAMIDRTATRLRESPNILYTKKDALPEQLAGLRVVVVSDLPENHYIIGAEEMKNAQNF